MKPVIVVTGMPRSGTSMMMQMLEQGGIPCSYKAGISPIMRNPNGCYEGGTIPQDGGVAIKQFRLIPNHDCYYIFMYRNPVAVARSWEAVSIRANRPMRKLCSTETHAKRQKDSLDKMKSQRHIIIDYDVIVENPIYELQKVKDFIPFPFDVEKASLVVDRGLYIKRQEENNANASRAEGLNSGNNKAGGSVEQSATRPNPSDPRIHFQFDMAYGWGRPTKSL